MDESLALAPIKRFTPSKALTSSIDAKSVSGFTPRAVKLTSQALSEIESLGLNEDQSSLPQQAEEVKDSM